MLAIAAAVFAVPEHAHAAGPQHLGSQVRVRSVVRADVRSGRLVRAVVVSPKVIASRPVSGPQDVDTTGAPVGDVVESLAKKYEVDPLLVHSVIEVESGYNPYAVSHKGAQGLMQLMPETARRFGVKNSFDAKENIEGGVRYLKYLDSLFPNDIRLTLAAYNAGEAAVWKYRNNIPPYRETEQYVYKVGTRYGKALREASRKAPPKKSPSSIAQTSPPVAAEPSYARLESYVDSDGRLYLRTVKTP